MVIQSAFYCFGCEGKGKREGFKKREGINKFLAPKRRGGGAYKMGGLFERGLRISVAYLMLSQW